MQLAAVGCLYDIDFYKSFLGYVSVPLVVLLLVGMVRVLFLLVGGSDGVQNSANKYCWKFIFYFLFLVYPSVSAKVLQVFYCRDVAGVWLLGEGASTSVVIY